MTLFRPLPNNWIVSVLMRTMSLSMAPPAQIEWEMTYSGVKTTVGPVICRAARSALVILMLPTGVHLFLCKTSNRGVRTMSSCC